MADWMAGDTRSGLERHLGGEIRRICWWTALDRQEGKRVCRLSTQADFISPKSQSPLELDAAFPLLEREQVEQKKQMLL